MFKFLFLTVLTSAFIVACGKQENRKRVLPKDDKGKAATKTQTPPAEVPEIELAKNLHEVDQELRKKGADDKQIKRFEKGRDILEILNAVDLTMKREGDKTRFELTVIAKSTEYKLKLSNGADDLSRMVLGKVLLQQRPSKDFLLRLKKDNSELGLLFSEKDGELKIIQVLGQDKNAELIKKLSAISTLNERAKKANATVEPIKTALNNAHKALAEIGLVSVVSEKVLDINVRLGKIEANIQGMTVDGRMALTTGGGLKSVTQENIAGTNLEELRKKVQEEIMALQSEQLAPLREGETMERKEKLAAVIKMLQDVQFPVVEGK
jgi:hypothetical protein